MVVETPYLREPGYAERYRDRRFTVGAGPATHRRETAALRALLRTVDGDGPWLDVPSGAGRLSDLLPGPVVQVDRDAAMLRACPQHGMARARASALALPFADDAFAGALCMRLLHHLPAAEERVAVLCELRRVARDAVLLSFFHSVSLQHWRRLAARRLGKRRSGRCAITRRQLHRDLAAAGLAPVIERPLCRFVSDQWIVLARPTPQK